MAIKPSESIVIDNDGLHIYTERPETVTTPDEVERLRARVAELEAMLRTTQRALRFAREALFYAERWMGWDEVLTRAIIDVRGSLARIGVLLEESEEES